MNVAFHHIARILRTAGFAGVLVAAFIAPTTSAVARAREPIALIPADALIAYQGRPTPDLPLLGDSPGALESLLALGGPLLGDDAAVQWWLRSAELFSQTIRREHAIGLLDVSAEPLPDRPDVKRMSRLRLALVVRLDAENPDPAPYMKIIQKAVNEQTSRAVASLEVRRVGPHAFQELRDKRLPAWCVLAWGRLDDCFVFTIGEDVWPDIAATADGRRAPIAGDAWYTSARASRGHKALIEVFVAMKSMRERLDHLVEGRVGRFFEAWGASGVERAYWALGIQDRALFCEATFREGDADTRRLYADPSFMDATLAPLVASDARYAVYRRPMGPLLAEIGASVLSLLSEREQALARGIWQSAAATPNVDLDRDLLGALGERVLLVNDPPHPLRVPVAVTSVTEIRGDADRARRALDALCGAMRDFLEQQPSETQPARFAWSLTRDDDGVWSVQLGPLAGPAWTLTDRYLVTSWSPAALRHYVSGLSGKKESGPGSSRPAP